MPLHAPETGVAESTNKGNFVQTEQKIKCFSSQPMFIIYLTTTITFLVVLLSLYQSFCPLFILLTFYSPSSP